MLGKTVRNPVRLADGRATAPAAIRRVLMCSVGMLAGLSAAPSLAQSAAVQSQAANQKSTVEEVVVTARKRSENLQQIPASIAAISANTIVEQHMTQIDDIGELVSNLHIVERNDNSPDVTLRGVGSFGVVQGVGFYVNDIQLFEGQIIRPEDIERIEVLKGPQGTLYGGANIGGAIKYVTKQPSNIWTGEATAEIGDFATKNFSAAVSGPIIPDKLLVRASAYDENQDGYIWDTFRKVNYGKTRDVGGRFTLVYEPDDLTKIHLYLDGDHFVTGAENLLYTPPNDHTYYYSVNDYYVPSFRRDLWSAAVQVDRDLNAAVALTSITSYFKSWNEGVTDFAKKSIPIDKLDQDQYHENYSEELRLTSRGQGNWDWLAGVFYQVHNLRYLNIDNFSTGDVNNPITVGQAHEDDVKRQTELAGFGNVGYKLDNWKFELGLRLEYYTSKEHAFNDAFTPAVDTSAHLDGFQASPRASIRYEFNRQLNVYATVSRGFEPGDEIEENGVVHPYKAEVADSYEMGLKSNPWRWLTFNTAVFYINYTDRLYQNIQFTPSGIVEVTSNIGPSHNYGVEFDFASKLPYDFKLSGGFGLTRAIWGDTPFIDPQTNLPINLKGRTAPFTPDASGNIVGEWTHRFAGDYVFGARIDAAFTGLSYWDPQDSAKQRPYAVANAGVRLEKGHWLVSAHISNFTKEKFNTIYAPSYDVGAPFSPAHVSRPREFVVTTTVKF
jgi:outer membrane receptor protein involved in Fe transport